MGFALAVHMFRHEGRIGTGLRNKYSLILHFYFARNIRSYMKKRPNNHDCILFNDYLYYDCDDEFLKRSYKIHEVGDRIKLLAAYFKRNRPLPYQTPFLLNHPVRILMEKRVKRRNKQKKKIKEVDDGQPFRGDEEFIQSVATEYLEASEGAFRDEDDKSYESKAYDIYADNVSQVSREKTVQSVDNFTFSNLMSLPLRRKVEKQPKASDEDGLTHLVCDFNDRDTERILREYQQLQELNKPKSQTPILNLKLNLDRLNKLEEPRIVNEKEQMKKKGEEKNKVYYVREAQRKYQLTSRSPENEYVFLTPRDYIFKEERTSTLVEQMHSDRTGRRQETKVQTKIYSPATGREDCRLNLYRQTERNFFEEQPTLTQRIADNGSDHYKRILDKMRESKRREVGPRATSPPPGHIQRLEKTKKLEMLKEKAAKLLRSKSPSYKFNHEHQVTSQITLPKK